MVKGFNTGMGFYTTTISELIRGQVSVWQALQRNVMTLLQTVVWQVCVCVSEYFHNWKGHPPQTSCHKRTHLSLIWTIKANPKWFITPYRSGVCFYWGPTSHLIHLTHQIHGLLILLPDTDTVLISRHCFMEVSLLCTHHPPLVDTEIHNDYRQLYCILYDSPIHVRNLQSCFINLAWMKPHFKHRGA